jgi:AraC family transcriptional regulator
MMALRDDLAQGSPSGSMVGESICTGIAAYSLRRYGVFTPQVTTYRRGLSKERLRMVVDYVEANLAQDLSIRQLAGVVQMGAHYFRKLFQISTGMPVHAYVLDARIRRAKYLLQYTRQSITEIATAVGFNSPSHLTAAFRRSVRTTPAAYRAGVSP